MNDWQPMCPFQNHQRTDMDKPTPPQLTLTVAGHPFEKFSEWPRPLIEAYGEAMAAWGAAQERERLQARIDDLISHLDEATTHAKTLVAENATPDCRTCRYKISDGCISTAQCVEGNLYRHTAPVRYWAKQGV